MADVEWMLETIENSEEGSNIGAFFDFDGTLIAGYSAAAFFKQRIRERDIGIKEIAQMVAESIQVERRGRDVDDMMRIGVQAQAGKQATEIDKWSRDVFARRIAQMVYPQARLLIDAHKRMGHTVVVASSATPPQIKPTADDLGIHNIVCTEVEIDEHGMLTGELASDIRWGERKAEGVADFAALRGIDLEQSFAYSNGAEDVPFLEQVGNPCALNPDEDLIAISRERGWPTARLAPQPKTSPADIVRSGVAIGVFGTSVATAAAFAVINQSRSLGANLAASVGSDLTLAAAGVRLNVVGQENLWSERPAIFLFNHQSQLDMFVLGALLRKDFTGVAKKSLEKDPLFAPIGYLANVAYIDRTNNAQARQDLQGAVDALHEGRSIAIAPEGTRSPTPRLLPFKKGPFHLAIQAGVPVVPMVMRNCGELMAAHSYVIHPGTVDVSVLPPVHTKGWTAKNLNTKIRGVRQMYLDTLANWPESL